MQSLTDSWKLSIADLRCDGLQQGKSKSFLKYYLVFSILGTKKKLKTDPARGDSSTWSQVFHIDVSDPKSTLHIEVYAKHKLRRDQLIGEVDVDISSVSPQQSESKPITTPISSKSSDGAPASITFTLYQSTTSSAVSEANRVIENMKDALPIVDKVHGAMDPATKTAHFLASFRALVDNLEEFTKVVDTLAEIHPYANCAWTILAASYKIVEAQKKRDDSVKSLVDVLNDAYEFVKKTTFLDLKDDQRRQSVVERLAQQTVECAYFIQEYARDPGFWTRTVKHSLDGSNKVITDFTKNIANLKAQFLDSSMVHTELVVIRMEVKIEDLKDKIDDLSSKIDDSSSRAILDDMAYVSARCSSEKACLLGTRVNILDEIVAWVNSVGENVPRVFWLTGVAGSGKSAIAHTIAQMFQQINRGSSFRFDVSEPERSRAELLYPTLSRDMAGLDLCWRASLVNILDKSKALRSTSSVADQFQSLFLEPCSTRMSIVGPIVLVIDALDECCGKDKMPTKSAREQLLKILSTEAAKLPSNFRILLTSRSEDDIHHALDGKQHVRTRKMEDIENTRFDIEHYVRDRLRDVEQLNVELPDEKWLEPLVSRSEESFQWAFTACRFIEGKDEPAGFRPSDNWSLLTLSSSDGLDGLYRTILDRRFKFEGVSSNDLRLSLYRRILGRVLDVRQPLPLNALNKLHIVGESESDASLIIKQLGSLLRGALETDTPIQALHTSFREFLTDEKRSGVYSISAGSQDTNLTFACLRVMQSRLRFNICGLETSYKRNSEVTNLQKRIEKHIPTHLRYACHFWAYHLQHVATADIITELKDFLSRRLLFWMEVMGLTKSITAASRQVSLLRSWVPTTDSKLVNIATEVTRFLDMSAAVIVEHTPHLYLSILPFVPASSMIATQYLHRFPRRIVVRHSTMTSWPSTALELLAHRAGVYSVAFSPDGDRIVSGSHDNTICVWDARTGKIAAGPFEHHSDGVLSVAFSPNGEQIVSGSWDSTIHLCDACTGEVAIGPFKGHTGPVSSVAFSLDGERIVSGSFDTTIRVWDARTGEVAAGPFEGHTNSVTSVTFSPNGEQVVSGSHDKTICIWNSFTGEITAGPFEAHSSAVLSVAFSPDGEKIVSGSWDNTVRVWHARTGEVATGPFEGHTSAVTSVSFSPDGEKIVSGSWDNTIRVWDARTGEIAAGPFEGHTSAVTSVAFSPNGEGVVSGSNDKTIRVWDAHRREGATGSFEGHTSWVRSVSFSPDGDRIVSGSGDKTICIWDAHTGQVAAGPFEEHTSAVTSVAFSPDGERIVLGSGDATIRVWDACTGEVAAGQFDGVIPVSCPPSGKRILSGSGRNIIHMLDTHAGVDTAGSFEGHTSAITLVAFSPDGERIASGSHDKTIRVWHARTGEVVAGPFDGHTEQVTSLAFSPDGERIVSGSGDATIRIWYARTGKVAAGPFEGHTNSVTSVAFSPDGDRIVSGSKDKTICVWDAHTGELAVGPFEGHSDGVLSVAFSPDGEKIVSGSNDNAIYVWDARTGKVVAGPFGGHTDWVWSVAFSPDGGRIVSGSDDGTIRAWDARSAEVAANRFVASNREVDHAISNYDKFGTPPENAMLNGRPTFASSFCDTSQLIDGWIMGQQGERLFWVPHDLRSGLLRPSNLFVIGRFHKTKLDTTHFVHGRDWAKCFDEHS